MKKLSSLALIALGLTMGACTPVEDTIIDISKPTYYTTYLGTYLDIVGDNGSDSNPNGDVVIRDFFDDEYVVEDDFVELYADITYTIERENGTTYKADGSIYMDDLYVDEFGDFALQIEYDTNPGEKIVAINGTIDMVYEDIFGDVFVTELTYNDESLWSRGFTSAGLALEYGITTHRVKATDLGNAIDFLRAYDIGEDLILDQVDDIDAYKAKKAAKFKKVKDASAKRRAVAKRPTRQEPPKKALRVKSKKVKAKSRKK